MRVARVMNLMMSGRRRPHALQTQNVPYASIRAVIVIYEHVIMDSTMNA